MGFKNNKEKGKAYSTFVVEELTKLGYTVTGQLIDFSNYGIPQKRTRFILVGINDRVLLEKSDLKIETFFSLLKNNAKEFLINKKLTINPTLSDAISDLLQSNGTIKSETQHFKAGIYGEIMSNYQKYLRKYQRKNSQIDSHRFVNHTEKVKSRFKLALKENLSGSEYKKKFNLKKCSTKLLNSNQPTPTLTTLPDDYIHYCEPRILTVREYARIQSFPDSYKFKGKYTTGGKRRTFEVPRYSQIGNAIPPLFAEQCGIVLKDLI